MECAEYFRSQAGYRRCFEELLKKWKSYGRPTGVITLEKTSEEERRLLGGILGKTFYDSTIRFSAADFERGLQKTKFAPVDMKELLESYFGRKILTNQQEKERRQHEKDRFFEKIHMHFAADGAGAKNSAAKWICQMREKKAFGFHLLSREFEKDPKEARVLAENTGRALQKLFPEKIPGKSGEAFRETVLAVFAAEISGNPHFFDRGTTGGQLLIQALCCITQDPLPENAHQWKELLLQAGIAPDYVSSLVHVYGVCPETSQGRHPAYEAFRLRREACTVTLENLRYAAAAWAPKKRVFAVENEMVFSFLAEQLRHGKADVGLLCTSGQPRTAALKLLELLAGAGYQILYSGDMDPEGITIADRLWKRFDGSVEIWKMAPADYRKGISGEVLKESRLMKMKNVEHPVLKETAAIVKKDKKAAYQENILRELLEDLLSEG